MKYSQYINRISRVISKDRIYTDELRRIAWGTDAGCYRMNPRVVVRAKDEEEVKLLLEEANLLSLPVTFRAAGTSLSGQSLTDSILIVAGKHWEKHRIDPDAMSIRLQPGIVGARVNEILRPYGRCLGPDPASIGSCMVGGMVINNSSGMSCGIHANSDKDIISAKIVLADGTQLDTTNQASRERFASCHSDILAKIEEIRDEILADKELYDKILYKYSIKNVTGLNLLPFVEHHDPFDIITHLMVGSEGTLAFLSEVRLKTHPIASYKASAMIYFKDIKTAAQAVLVMKDHNVAAAEMLDKRSLAAAHDTTGVGLTAILTEVQAETDEQLKESIQEIENALKGFNTVTPIAFTTNPAEYSKFWAIRSGIFPAVGGLREQGTTCIIEDVAFHIEDLPEATQDLSDLLDKHGYHDSCIYGHALEGNFHFIINQSFDSPEQVKRYEAMIDDVVKLVVGKYNGSLKAEHGTGRNMAPFVCYEWGEKAYGIMKRIKALFDPNNILNPGVIFNDDIRCHLKNLKTLPVIKPENGADITTQKAFNTINKCIECGFCEVNCVSCGFSLSSRTRIVINREIARRKQVGEDYSSLLKQYKYLGEETCAGDNLCSMSCPMGIKVGDLTHELRRQHKKPHTLKTWKRIADHFSDVKEVMRVLLSLARVGEKLLSTQVMSGLGKLLHKVFSIPLWTPSMPGPYKYKQKEISVLENQQPKLKVVYLPSCINQTMGIAKNAPVDKPLVDETIELLEKAGCEVIIPFNHENLCCGTIWESKGMPEIANKKTKEVEEALIEASNGGEYPILSDQSPCLHRLREKIQNLKLFEPSEFILEYLKDRLVWHKQETPIAIHITCTMRLMKLDKQLYELASMCSDNVLIPTGVGCCAFAGDKGFTHPELNSWALRKLQGQIDEKDIKIGYSNSRTCEIGLQTNSGIPYVSIVYLVNQCTTPL